jgi:hypothetical protein
MPTMLENLLKDICLNDNCKISCIVADVNMGWALNVGSKFGINGALFWSSSAAMFAMVNNIPKLIDDGIIDSDGKNNLFLFKCRFFKNYFFMSFKTVLTTILSKLRITIVEREIISVIKGYKFLRVL